MRQYLNWKTYLIIAAMCIVAASLYYTNRLASKLADEELKRVELVVEAIKLINHSDADDDMTFAFSVLTRNETIPFIVVDDSGRINQHNNIDSAKIRRDPDFLDKKLRELKTMHPPIVAELGYGLGKNYVYYGESYLLTQLRYFPYVQLTIILLFLIVVLIAFGSAHRSIQNQVWVGLSKETAHQLGTPLSSIEAWIEILKEDSGNKEALEEMQKDINRLNLIADRFGKVGSAPKLFEENVIERLGNMVDYMQKRASQKVLIQLKANEQEVLVNLSGPLFDWVIENLIRNALDAMQGAGNIELVVSDSPQQVRIDISDTGKGIPRHQVKKIFNPGFTTKKRGWGLGLSLSRRIIEQYHHGSLFVKQSEVGKGTTFRIILRR